MKPLNFLSAVALWAVFLWPVSAQTIPNHAVPVSRGPGVAGQHFVGPCATGAVIAGNGSSADPTCLSFFLNAATTFFVRTTGNDSNDCLSSANPCLTITGALVKARNFNFAKQTVQLNIRGTYTESVVCRGPWVAEPSTFVRMDGGGDTLTTISPSSGPAIEATDGCALVVQNMTLSTSSGSSLLANDGGKIQVNGDIHFLGSGGANGEDMRADNGTIIVSSGSNPTIDGAGVGQAGFLHSFNGGMISWNGTNTVTWTADVTYAAYTVACGQGGTISAPGITVVGGSHVTSPDGSFAHESCNILYNNAGATAWRTYWPGTSNFLDSTTGGVIDNNGFAPTSPLAVDTTTGILSCATCGVTGSPLSQFAATTSAQLRGVISDETGTGLAYFQGGALGTPASGTLTNATGLPISSGVSGLGTGVATFLATPSSANLASALTNETGTGAAVFATSPTLVTPALGAATATSVNKVAITAPASSATLTIANGKTLTANNSITLAGTDATTLTGPSVSANIGDIANVQVFTAAGTYTPTAGVRRAVVEAVGGGGGGGGIAHSGTAKFGASGGGSGERAILYWTAPSSQTVTIGAGGTAGANTGGNGGTGGTTSLGAVVTALGGSGGNGATATATLAGGAGGTGGAGATIAIPGSPGGNVTGNGGTVAMAGNGGGPGGGAAPAGSDSNGTAGARGGGGSGAFSNGGGTDQSGGVGGAGYIIITEYS